MAARETILYTRRQWYKSGWNPGERRVDKEGLLEMWREGTLPTFDGAVPPPQKK